MYRCLFALLLIPFASGAQNVHKWVDKDGKVNFGDMPPDNQVTEQVKIRGSSGGEGNGTVDRNFMIGRWKSEAQVSYGTQIPAQIFIFTAISQGSEGHATMMPVKGYKIDGNTITVLGGITQVYTVIDRNTVSFVNALGKTEILKRL